MGGKSATYEEVMALHKENEKLIKELIQSNKETSLKMAETDRKMAEIDLRLAETDRLIAENGGKTAKADLKLTETDKLLAEAARMIAENGKQINGISTSNGMIAQNAVYNSLEKRMTLGGVAFDDIQPDVRKKRKLPNGERIEGEYDVVLHNGSSVALIEAKYRVRLEDVERLIDVQMPMFKRLFPEYKDFTVYLGIGGMSFEAGVEKEALRRGVATLKLDGGAVVEINDANIKAWN